MQEEEWLLFCTKNEWLISKNVRQALNMQSDIIPQVQLQVGYPLNNTCGIQVC